MKNLSFILLLLLILACENQAIEQKNSIEGQTTIEINNNIQLFRIAYNLAIADSIDTEYRPCNNTLYQATKAKYSKYSNHPLVETIRNGDIWSADLPVIALCFDENFEVLPNIDKEQIAKDFDWYGNNLDSLSLLLKAFKAQIGYTTAPQIAYDAFLDSLAKEKIIEKLNDFFRQENQPNLKILFDPQNNITNKAITFVKQKPNDRLFLLGYFCDHPDSTTQEIQLNWDNDYKRIVFHENAHLYTDELLKKYADTELDSLINQTKFEEEYTDIDEIIVRGITAKILAIHYGKKVGEYEISIQPPKSKIVFDVLDEYINNSSMEFEMIYKKIIDALKKAYQ